MMGGLGRRKKDFFKSTGSDAAIFKTSDLLRDSTVSYFSGIPGQFLGNNLLVMTPDSRPLLLKSLLEPRLSSKEVRIKNIDRRKQLEGIVRGELRGARAIAINRPFHTLNSLKALGKIAGGKKLVDASKQVGKMRSVKSEDEVSKISTACKIAEKAISEVPCLFKKGMSEKELGLKIELLLREKGDNMLPFPLIVAGGANGAFPHHVPLLSKISKGLLLLDIGACYRGYCSDITRVFSLGKPSRMQKGLYAGVFAAKQSAQSMIMPGAVAGNIFDGAEELLKRGTGFGLVHGLGHGLGLDAHDFPSGFFHGSAEKLRKNNVLTVEPGVYGKFGGIRIEDDVVVTARGCRPLTRAPEELVAI
jgi:Xaa-Pro aminopeptidase